MDHTAKTCSSCHTSLPVSHFTPGKSKCKECRATEERIRRVDRKAPASPTPGLFSDTASVATHITQLTSQIAHYQTAALSIHSETQERIDLLVDNLDEVKSELREVKSELREVKTELDEERAARLATEKRISELETRNKRFDEYVAECDRLLRKGELKVDFVASLLDRTTPLVRLGQDGKRWLILPFFP